MNKSLKRAFSTVLAATIAVCSPLLSTYAKAESIEESADMAVVDTAESEYVSGVLSIGDVPECLDYKAISNNKHTVRLYDKETALDTVLFANKDGSETIYIFNEDVKYIDENGKTADKSNKLYSNIESRAFLSDYSYVNKENDINTYFPKVLKTDVGVSVEAQGQVIEMYPISEVVSGVAADDDMYGVYYDDVFGEFTGIRYEPSFSGYKEDIVLEKNVGNKFSFILETGNLVPVLENGVIYIRDEDGVDFGIISPTYVYDSFVGDAALEEERHFTYDNKFELTRISDGKYELVVIVDEEFLSNPATVYPVIVDPSITINATGSGSSKSILDTPIYNGSGAPGTAGVNSLAVVGYVDSSYGSGRLLMRFPGLMKQTFMSQNYKIDSATLTMSECSGGSASSTVYAYNYTGPTWDETTKYSYSAYNGVGSSIDFWSFSYPNYTTRSYNITSAVKSWQLDSSKGNKGIIFKNTTSESDYSKTKTFYTTEGATKPYLSVTYSRFYGCRGYNEEDSIKINCLAFAFNQNSDTFWEEYFTNSDKVYCEGATIQDALTLTKDRMRSWLNDKFHNKWRPVDRYDEPLASNEWLVAMRVGVNSTIGYDYHFWYRANDGRWCNKHGTVEGESSERLPAYIVDPSTDTATNSSGWSLKVKFIDGSEYVYPGFYSSSTQYYAIAQ